MTRQWLTPSGAYLNETVSTQHVLGPYGYVDQKAGGNVLSVFGVTSGEAFGSATVSSDAPVEHISGAGGIPSGEAFGASALGRWAYGAVQYVGSASGVSTATLPAHQAGDVIFAVAYNHGTSFPGAPVGWSAIQTMGGFAYGATVGLYYRISLDGATVAGTWTNTTSVAFIVYRGGDSIDPVGIAGLQENTANSFVYPALSSPQVPGGQSPYLAYAATDALDATIETPPSGTVLRCDELSAASELALFDTNVATTWPGTTVSVTGSNTLGFAGAVEIVPATVRREIVSATGIAPGEAFGTPAFSTGSGAGVTVSPTGVSSAEIVGNPAASRQSVQAATITGITSAQAFGAPTVGRQSVASAEPVAIPSSEAFGALTASRTAVAAVSAQGISSTETFGTVLLTRAAMTTVAPTSVASEETFGSPTLVRAATATVLPSSAPSGEAFGAPVVSASGMRTVVAVGIPSVEAFGAATAVRQAFVVVSLPSIGTTEALGSPTTTRVSLQSIAITGIQPEESFGATAISSTDHWPVAPASIAPAEALGAPTVIPTIQAQRESRIFTVPAATDRLFAVPPEDRGFFVPPEARDLSVPAESRLFTVPKEE